MSPIIVLGELTGQDHLTKTELELVIKCPRKDCARFLIARYNRNIINGRIQPPFRLYKVVPFTLKPFTIPKEVTEVSTLFTEIYCQAAAAESYGLTQIAGVGYRKSLEFLIKDFCISKNPEKAEEIKSKFLGNCINEHIDNENLKECARRATWLGNDETHYVRKWENRDINDLKTLIELTISWVNTNILTDQYLRGMPNNQPAKSNANFPQKGTEE